MRGAEAIFKLTQHRSASEAEVDIEARNLIGPKVAGIATLAKSSYGDRRVDVIESFDGSGGIEEQLDCRIAIGKVRPDHPDVAVRELKLRFTSDFGPLTVNADAAKFRIREVAIVRVPIEVVLEEGNVVTASVERPTEGTKRGGVPIAPRRGDRQSKDDDLHLGTLCGLGFRTR